MLSVQTPVFAYPGGKGRLAEALVSLMPKSGRRYVEPFVGRGNVFFAAAGKLRFRYWYLNDLNTASFFTALQRTRGDVQVPERTRLVYEQLKQQKEGELRTLLEPYLTRDGGGYRRSGFGNQRGRSPESYGCLLRKAAQLLVRAKAKISATEWYCLPFSSFNEQDFVYFDPPYFGADVRAYHDYTVNYFSLIKLLSTAKFRWMLSEYPSNLYLEAFGKPFCTMSVQLACDGNGTKRRTECVWINYQPDSRLG
jgi:site-specific DNA-adenine methylase